MCTYVHVCARVCLSVCVCVFKGIYVTVCIWGQEITCGRWFSPSQAPGDINAAGIERNHWSHVLRLSRSHFLSTLLTRMLTLIMSNAIFKSCPSLLFCDSCGDFVKDTRSYSGLSTSGKLYCVHRHVNLAQAYFLFTLLFKWGQPWDCFIALVCDSVLFLSGLSVKTITE